MYRQEEYTVYTKDLINCPVFYCTYTVLNDKYEVPEDIKFCNSDPQTVWNTDFMNFPVKHDKSTFDDVIVDGTSMTIKEILNSDNNSKELQLFSRSIIISIISCASYKEQVVQMLMRIVQDRVLQIYSHMPNYTDYIALNNAMKSTLNYYNIMLRAQLDEIPLGDVDVAMKILTSFDIKSIFERFLTELPGEEALKEVDEGYDSLFL